MRIEKNENREVENRKVENRKAENRKVDKRKVENRRVETDDKKEKVINDEADEMAREGVDTTNNLDLPNAKGVVVPESEDQNQIDDADVVESLIEEKQSLMN